MDTQTVFALLQAHVPLTLLCDLYDPPTADNAAAWAELIELGRDD